MHGKDIQRTKTLQDNKNTGGRQMYLRDKPDKLKESMKNVSQRGHDITKKAFFRYVNSKLTVRPEITEMLKENGELENNDNKLAFVQTRFPAAADPIEHISDENFLLQIFAKMETFFLSNFP